ncbi:hypothetical protein P4238_24990 [Pseudomonas aeruginosa]|nr:hypothetical protein [Pseudomonas aeruginosa]
MKIYLEQVSSSSEPGDDLPSPHVHVVTRCPRRRDNSICNHASLWHFGQYQHDYPLEVVLAIAALAALVTSALLSARALQKSAFDVAPLLHNPFPSADSVIDSIFDADDIDERQILRKLYFALDKTVEHQPPLRLSTRLITLFLIGGLFLTGASFLL